MSTIDPLAVRARVARESGHVPPSWPLESFIATNPLGGFESEPFGDLVADPPGDQVRVVRSHAEYLQERDAGRIPRTAVHQALAETVPELHAFFAHPRHGARARDLALAALDLPIADPAMSAGPSRRDDPSTPAIDAAAEWIARLVLAIGDDGPSLYPRFHAGATRDLSLPIAVRRRLRHVPAEPEAAIEHCAPAAAPDADQPIRAALLALPGWSSSFARAAQRDSRLTLTDLVAVVLATHYAFALPLPTTALPPLRWPDARAEAHALLDAVTLDPPATTAEALRVLALLTPPVRLVVWQSAVEAAHRADVRAALERPLPAPERVETQAVFCIDTRSEGLRRHIETIAPVETFGFAGFFAVPLVFAPAGSTQHRDYYPALLSQGTIATEAVDTAAAERLSTRLAVRDALRRVRSTAGGVPVASFAWAEAAGWFEGIRAAARTIVPRAGTTATAETTIDVCERVSVSEQTDIAEAVLRIAGLTTFSPLVVFVGHVATTTNNLYRAALDCGACGGNSGAPNARAIAAILNNPPVRQELAARGITIPEHTWVAAALHDTTRDRVEVLDAHLVPESHRADVERFEARCADAAQALTRERAHDLPGAERASVAAVRRRAHDWAEMFPELGLAGNASLIIGPRAMSRGTDLARRSFLHSYDPHGDPDGSALEVILTGPLVVAQWINHQYYFSTLNPQRHGAGNKNLHNAIGSLGVWSGYGGDLRTGLPWQSLAAGDTLLHTPARLSVFVQAPLERITRIVSDHDTVRDLLDHEWISLHARADAGEPWHRYTPYGFRPAPLVDEVSAPQKQES